MARRTSATTRAAGTKRPLPRAKVTDPAVAEVTDAQTTADPDGNESVVEMDGTPVEPYTDPEPAMIPADPLPDSATGTAPLDVTAGDSADPVPDAPVDVSGAETDVPADVPADPAAPVDPNPSDKLTDTDILESKFRRYWQKRLDDAGMVPPKGRILFPGEPLTYSGHRISGDVMVVSEDVYRVVFPFRSITPTFTLEARKGKRIPRAKVMTKAEYLRTTNAMIVEVD